MNFKRKDKVHFKNFWMTLKAHRKNGNQINKNEKKLKIVKLYIF